MSQDIKIPTIELEKITDTLVDAITKGLAPKSRDESNFHGEMQKRFSNIEKILATNSEADEVYRKTVDTHISMVNAHIKRTEPMILSYEKDSSESMILNGFAKKWGIRLGLMASAITAWYIIKEFVIKLFMK